MHFLATLLAAFILLGIASATPVARDVKMCYPKQTWGAGRANILLEKNNLERWALNATVAHGKVSRVYSVKAVCFSIPNEVCGSSARRRLPALFVRSTRTPTVTSRRLRRS